MQLLTLGVHAFIEARQQAVPRVKERDAGRWVNLRDIRGELWK